MNTNMIYNRKEFRFFDVALIIVGLVLISFSCSYFTEPNPEANNDVHVPQVHDKNAVFNNYSVDHIVAGTITPAFIPDWGLSGTDSIVVFVDSIRIVSLQPWVNQDYDRTKPFIFSINTSSWPDGRHHFMLYAYKRPTIGDSIGLLSLKFNTLYIYETSLIFDNTLPTAPTDVSITFQNNYPVISWTPTDLKNFYSYIIKKDGKVIATLYSQQTASYVDSTLPDFYKGYYEIGASNGPVTAYSPKDTCMKGQSLGFSVQRAIDNLNDQVVFNLSNNYLTSVSTQTHTVITQGSNGHDGLLAKSIDNDILYCWDHQYLYTYDLRTLNILGTQNSNIVDGPIVINEVTGFTAGPGNKLYVAVQYWNTSQGDAGFHPYLSIVNDNNAAGVGSPHAIDLGGVALDLSVSPDGGYLLANVGGIVTEFVMESDRATSSVQVTSTHLLGGFLADWKNSRVFIISGTNTDKEEVETWDTRTMSRIGSYQLPASIHYYGQLRITARFANPSKLYLAYNSNILAEYDINSRQFLRSWTFSSTVQSLYGSDNGRYLFACTSTDQWIVDIGGGQ